MCRRKDHKSHECPDKGKPVSGQVKKESSRVRPVSVTFPREGKKNVVKGKVNGVLTDILVDSGADNAVTPGALAYLGGHISREYAPHCTIHRQMGPLNSCMAPSKSY